MKAMIVSFAVKAILDDDLKFAIIYLILLAVWGLVASAFRFLEPYFIRQGWEPTLDEIRCHAREITVAKDGDRITLKPEGEDYKPHDFRRYCTGNGSREKPYQYGAALPVSPHYVIMDLWRTYRSSGPVFIRANDRVLQVCAQGVTSEDGQFFTSLMPQ